MARAKGTRRGLRPSWNAKRTAKGHSLRTPSPLLRSSFPVRLRPRLAPRVLIVDEFGIWPYDRDSATAFFSLVSARYERGSIILTSSKGFAGWGELLGDSVIATAILDRLLHHSHVINIRGESYRLRDKRQAGLMTSQRLPNTSSEEHNNQPGLGQI